MMNKSIGKIVGLISILLILSCSKDEDNSQNTAGPENLTGTTWRSSVFPGTDVEYALLEFLSQTQVQGSTKRPEQEIQIDWTGIYEIVNDSIFIDYEVEGLKGRITDIEIIFTTEESFEIRFVKQ
ncbi:hypothetical protein [Poritiphilus flavus]|uniref:Lipoprotein n=1 Tax=Poritiphilus flavus TaxID=2697053 RepID=A0A6L9EF86_9FLAO|nr:hypothetical protein [Poritiphilus flavus]NAS13158.1 hypothetical protein [Poritiphilus flavus]